MAMQKLEFIYLKWGGVCPKWIVLTFN